MQIRHILIELHCLTYDQTFLSAIGMIKHLNCFAVVISLRVGQLVHLPGHFFLIMHHCACASVHGMQSHEHALCVHIPSHATWHVSCPTCNRSLPSRTLLVVLWQMCHVWITDWIVRGSVEMTDRSSYTKKNSTILHVLGGFMTVLPCLEPLQDI